MYLHFQFSLYTLSSKGLSAILEQLRGREKGGVETVARKERVESSVELRLSADHECMYEHRRMVPGDSKIIMSNHGLQEEAEHQHWVPEYLRRKRCNLARIRTTASSRYRVAVPRLYYFA